MSEPLLLREKQIKTFQHLIINHRFLDRSQAGTGKTAPHCALTGFLLRMTPETLEQKLQLSGKLTSTSLTSWIRSNKLSAFNTTKEQFSCRIIWIQPSSLLNKNRKEILDWNPDLKPDQVKIVKGTHNQRTKISLDENTLVWLMTAEAYAKYIGDMRSKFTDIVQVICDEPHLYYRGFNSKRTQAFVINTPDWNRVNFMTATPTPRGKLQGAYIYAHMIQKSYYGTIDFFMRTHAELDEYGSVMEWKNHHILKAFLENYSICWTTKDMYGDVPEFIVRDVLPMEEKVAKVYNQFEQEGIAEIKEIVLEAKTGGTNSLRIRQMLAHPHAISLPIDWDLKGNPIKFEQANIFDGVTPKLDRILEYAEEGEPLIIFGTFTAEIEKIAEYLASKKYRVGVIHGGVPQNRRNNIDLEFQRGNLDVVVCSAATAGVGFNWGHVNTVIFHSLNYGDDEFLQAVARAKRGVRKEPLRIVLLEYEETADQYVMWAVHHNSKSSNKANPDNPVIYFPKATTNHDDALGGLSMDYLKVG